jgi:hypothetical protein
MIDSPPLLALVEKVDELDAALGKPGRHVDHPLQHEGVEAVAGPRVIGTEREVRQHRHAEGVGLLDRELEREVVLGTLSGLDPVKEILSPGPRSELADALGQPEAGVRERGEGHGWVARKDIAVW